MGLPQCSVLCFKGLYRAGAGSLHSLALAWQPVGPRLFISHEGYNAEQAAWLEGPLGIQIYSLGTWDKASQTHSGLDAHALREKTKKTTCKWGKLINTITKRVIIL